MGESEATEKARQGEKLNNNIQQTCTEQRVEFNKAVPVKDRSGTPGDEIKREGSQRPARSATNIKTVRYWESPVHRRKTLTKMGEKRFKCKYCKVSFSAASRLSR